MFSLSNYYSSFYSWFFSASSPFWRRWLLALVISLMLVSFHWIQYTLFVVEGRVDEFRSAVLADGGNLAPEGILPLLDPDGAKWSMQVLEAFRTGDWSLSKSAIDAVCVQNGPTPVYWARGYFFYLAVLSGIFQFFGFSLEAAVAWGAFLSGPLLLFFTLVVFTGLGLRVLPGVWGLFLGPLLVLEPSVPFYYASFFPDHHGMIAFCVMIWVLAFFLPFYRGWVISGIALGFSLWLSVLTTVPLLGCFGVGALVSCAYGCPWVKDAKVFRKWALLASVVSMGFWVFDYFLVGRAGMRLEVVHPLWAFAIWGGGELLFRLSLLLEGRIQPGFLSPSSSVLGWLLAILAVFAPVFGIVYSDGSWFWPSYPWVSDLMQVISELQPVSLVSILFESGLILVFLIFGLGGFWGKSWVAGFALSTLLCYVMCAFQARWGIFATIFGVIGFLLLFSEGAKATSKFPDWVGKLYLRGISCVLLLVFFFLGVPLLVNFVNSCKERDLMFSKGAAFERALEEARLFSFLREDHGGPGFVTIGVSDVGALARYYGGGRTVGSVYWEAWQGLKASAGFWGAKADYQVWDILDRYGVDYVIFRQDMESSFSGGPQGLEGPTVQQCVVDGNLPPWLVPLNWKPKGNFPLKVFRVVRDLPVEAVSAEEAVLN